MSKKIRTGKMGNSLVSIGRFTYGVERTTIFEWGEGANLTFGNFCSIASGVKVFLGGGHRIDWCTTFPFGHEFTNELGTEKIPGHPTTKGDVSIGHDVWIGHGATIMSGVTIGTGAVIANNSHVVSDVDNYEVVGGNPAKLIKKRFPDEIIKLFLELRWWDLPIEKIIEMKYQLSAQPTEEIIRYMINENSEILREY